MGRVLQRPVRHTIVNTGKTPIHNLIVELKEVTK